MLFVYCFLVVVVATPAFSARAYPPKLECTAPHEHYECGSACQTECATFGEVCPILNVRCNDACYCDDGYARDETNRCIRIQECPRVKH